MEQGKSAGKMWTDIWAGFREAPSRSQSLIRQNEMDISVIQKVLLLFLFIIKDS